MTGKEKNPKPPPHFKQKLKPQVQLSERFQTSLSLSLSLIIWLNIWMNACDYQLMPCFLSMDFLSPL